jgi:uncharacterized protein (DUF302 family)
LRLEPRPPCLSRGIVFGGFGCLSPAGEKMIDVRERIPMLKVLESRKTVQEIEAVFQEVCAQHKFGVLGTINLKQKLNDKGVPFERECLVFEICNPHQAKKVLEDNIAISTVLPCRISVYQDNGVTKIATIRPTALLGLFPNPALKPVAQEVEEALTRIMQDLA